MHLPVRSFFSFLVEILLSIDYNQLLPFPDCARRQWCPGIIPICIFPCVPTREELYLSPLAATHPLDLIKVRIQVARGAAGSAEAAAEGIWKTGLKVFSTEGVPGLYKGYMRT